MKTFPIKIGNVPLFFNTWLLNITMFSGRIIYKWIIFNSKLSKNQRVLSPIKLVMIHWFMMVYENGIPLFSASSLGYTPYNQYGGVLKSWEIPMGTDFRGSSMSKTGPGSTGSGRWKQYVYGRRGRWKLLTLIWCFEGDLR